jgi:hypothetical protein
MVGFPSMLWREEYEFQFHGISSERWEKGREFKIEKYTF